MNAKTGNGKRVSVSLRKKEKRKDMIHSEDSNILKENNRTEN